jgi:hypothetical protein
MTNATVHATLPERQTPMTSGQVFGRLVILWLGATMTFVVFWILVNWLSDKEDSFGERRRHMSHMLLGPSRVAGWSGAGPASASRGVVLKERGKSLLGPVRICSLRKTQFTRSPENDVHHCGNMLPHGCLDEAIGCSLTSKNNSL